METTVAAYRPNGIYMELYSLLNANAETLVVESTSSGLPVGRICENVCARNNSLKAVMIADSVKSIGNSAFYYCKNLEAVQLPKELQILENNAFNSCVSLRRVHIPEGTLFIGNRAFYDDRNLEFAEIPASVMLIGNNAFANCPKLKVKVVPGSYAEAYAKQNGLSVYDESTAPQTSNADISIQDVIKSVVDDHRKTYVFTLKHICEVANISIPDEFLDQADVRIPAIKCFGTRVKTGEALFLRGLYEDGKPASRNYNEDSARKGYKNGARFIFSKEQYYTRDGAKLPCIIVDDPNELFIKLCQKVRRSFPEKMCTVAITGSIGKTTTKDMFTLIAAEKFKTETSYGNSNGFGSIAAIMQRIKKDTEVYVQEVGAYFPNLIEDDARILSPNACVVTNIGTSHIDLYGSVENIAHDKLALARHLSSGGMAFLNFDDKLLSRVKLDCNVTWFSAENPQADYYATNIRVINNTQEFDVVGKKSTVHIRLQNIGYHNVINAVSAVAFGQWLGLSDSAIAAALAKFKTTGMRQNLSKIGGYNVFMDCFNSSPSSLEAAIKTMMRVELPAGNKRIAVLGDMLKMGDLSEQLHTDTGRTLAKYDVDLYLCYGPYMRYMAEQLSESGRNVFWTESRDQLNKWIEEYAKQDDLILFKAGHRMYLAKTVDAFLGTAFYLTDVDVDLANGEPFETEDVSGRIIEGYAKIQQCKTASPCVTIPGTVSNATVYRIHDNAFARKNTLTELIFEDGVSNIGFAAFYYCSKLKRLVLPNTLKILERSAFNSCTGLQQLVLPESVTTIGERAFYDCVSLQRVYVGDNVLSIGPEAFKKCSKLTVYGHENTYVQQYCKAEGIPFHVVAPQTVASNFSEST